MHRCKAVADPGFSAGGAPTPWGGGDANLRRGCFLAKMYAKTKDLGPVINYVISRNSIVQTVRSVSISGRI